MRILIGVLLPLAGFAAVWPDHFGTAKLVGAAPAGVSDRKLWDEYGFRSAETARYEGGGRKFTATAYKLQDSTAALGAFEWQRPANAGPGKAGPLSAETADGLMMAHGNYLLVIAGYRPPAAEMTAVAEQLSGVEMAPLPNLPGFMPAENLVPNSQRYVLGPEALARFVPGVPPSVAAFHMGAEAQVASYRDPSGELRLALFSYPTPQLAMQRHEAFSKLSGVMAKRSGPLVAVVLQPANADAAEVLLAKVRYQGIVTMSEHIPTARDNIGNLVINAFKLIGILLLFATASGLAFAAVRMIGLRGKKTGEDLMITLDLRER
jgi:hypothetical protein